MNVLVVDDEEDVRGALVLVVRYALGEGHAIVESGHPADALAKLDALDAGPLLVIADQGLPSAMSGWRLLHEIGRRRPDARRVLTSAIMPEDFDDAPEAGSFHLFLGKPFDFARAVALLRRAAAGGSQES